MWVIRAVLGIVLFIVLVGFAVYNAGELVSVQLLQTRYINVPLIVVVFWAFLIGLVIAFLFFVTVYFKQVAEIRQLKRQNGALSSEIVALRNRPIEEANDKFLLSDKDEDK